MASGVTETTTTYASKCCDYYSCNRCAESHVICQCSEHLIVSKHFTIKVFLKRHSVVQEKGIMKLDIDPWGRLFGGIPYNGHTCLRVSKLWDYKYIKVVRFFLRCVSGWPMRELNEKPLFCEGKYHGIYNTSLSIVFFSSQLWYLVENATRLKFIELGNMYVALLLNIVSTSRGFTLCLSKAYKLLAVRFLTEMHLFYHKDHSDYSRLVYYQVHKICSWFTGFQTAMLAMAVLLFCGVPPYLNYAKGKFETRSLPANTTYELSIYFKLPFDPETSFNSYCYSFVLNFYAAYLCGASLVMFDTFLSVMIFNLWGHFKVLLHALMTFPKPKAMVDNTASKLQRLDVMYSEEEQIMIYSRLKESIAYHRMIMDFVNEMSECFGMVLFIYFTFHQASGCLLLLECAQGPEGLARYLPLTVMMFSQLIQISIIFETIGSMSEKVKDEVYCLPWEYMDSKNRSIVMIFLINVQTPVHVKAGGLVDVGVSTMAGILKASLSYFAFLNTMS